MHLPLTIASLHYFCCSVGIVVNISLLAIILQRTPHNLKCYSVLLFSQTFLQTVTIVASTLLFMRLIPKDSSVFMAMSGPVSYTGSAQLGYYLYSIMLHGHAHYPIVLALCFIYRYYIILRPTPLFSTMIYLAVLTYLPTPLIFWECAQVPVLDQQTAKLLISERGELYFFGDDEMVTCLPDIFQPRVFIAIAWASLPCLPAYTVIIICGLLLYRKLAASAAHMSEKTRVSHKEIGKGLMLQACLPLLYIFSVGTYVVGQLNILNLVVLEYTTHVLGEVLLAASPLLTLYYVQPYRRVLQPSGGRKLSNTISASQFTFR